MLVRPSAPSSIIALDRLRERSPETRDIFINVLRRIEDIYVHLARVLNDEEDAAWTTLAYGTDWAAFGSGYETPSYRLAWGIVWLRGRATTTGTTTTVGTLPSGYRPANTLIYTPWMSGPAYLIVNTDGTLVVDAAAAGYQTSLDGVSFHV